MPRLRGETPNMSKHPELEVVVDQYPVVNYHYKNTPWRQPTRGELREYLIKHYKNCFWCGIECTNKIPKEGEKHEKTLGTIDHVIALADRTKGVAVPKVLACYKCNEKRSIVQNPNNHLFPYRHATPKPLST